MGINLLNKLFFLNMRASVIACLIASTSAITLNQMSYIATKPADCKTDGTETRTACAAFPKPADCKTDGTETRTACAAFPIPADCKTDGTETRTACAAFPK